MNLSIIKLFWGILLFFPFSPLWGQGQTMVRCGNNEIIQTIQDQGSLHRFLQKREQNYLNDFESHSFNESARSACNLLTIPVVVHVIYNDANSNISNAQIQSQIDVLNQDYRRIKGTTGYGIGVDTEIQFCLASKTPNGSLSTGITRTQSNLTNHQILNDAVLKSIISWNDSFYLNIWVVKQIVNQFGDPVLGYSSMPGLPGISVSGVVVQGKSFGTVGTVVFPFNRGRTVTHEIGHFLGLYHTFETDGQCEGGSPTSCLTEGDRVCDTPSEEGPVFGCPTEMVNSCPDTPCDHIDRLSNYMNFADDICMDHFTRGQADRMRFFLNSSLSGLVDGSNANASSCSEIIPPVKLPEPEFSVSSEILCPGDAVTFLDITLGCNDSVFWEFEGGIPARDSTSNPAVVYLEEGLYKVKLTIVNKLGRVVRNFDHFIHVASDSLVDSLDEGFEGGIFEPENWLKQGSAGPSSWVRNTFTSSLGEASVVLPNFTTASCGTNEDLITPPIGLEFAKSAVLFFDYAYQQRSANSASFDRLLILVSEDCGLSFKDTIFDRSGPTLATIPGIGPNQIFLPESGSNQWKTRNISLDKYVGNKAVRLMFRGIGQKGQHLYLDNIIITTTVSVGENIDNKGNVTVFPNPFHDSFQIEIHAKEASHFYIRLMDMHGRKLLDSKQNMAGAGNHLFHFDQTLLNSLAPGLYLLEVETQFGRFVRKIVKL